MKAVNEIFNLNKTTFEGTMAELLGEHLLKEDQLKEIRTAVINFITATKKTFNDGIFKQMYIAFT